MYRCCSQISFNTLTIASSCNSANRPTHTTRASSHRTHVHSKSYRTLRARFAYYLLIMRLNQEWLIRNIGVERTSLQCIIFYPRLESNAQAESDVVRDLRGPGNNSVILCPATSKRAKQHYKQRSYCEERGAILSVENSGKPSGGLQTP